MGTVDEKQTRCSCTKALLMFFTVIFWVISCVIIVLALLMIFEDGVKMFVKAITGDNVVYTDALTYGLLALGILQFLVTYIGCYGSMSERKSLLGLFVFSVFLIISIEVAAVVLVIIFKDAILTGAKSGLSATQATYYTTNSSATVFFWNFLHLNLNCCGVNNFTDFANYTFELPCTCVKEESCDVTTDKVTYLTSNLTEREKGCFDSLNDTFINNQTSVIAMGCAFGAFELLLFVLGIIVCCGIPKRKKFDERRPSQNFATSQAYENHSFNPPREYPVDYPIERLYETPGPSQDYRKDYPRGHPMGPGYSEPGGRWPHDHRPDYAMRQWQDPNFR